MSQNNTYYDFQFENTRLKNGAFVGGIGLSWVRNIYNNWKFNINTAFRSPNIDDLAKVFDSVPGSLDFFNYADSKGVEIIYLSNRRVENYEPTKENLISLGFPFKESTKMLLRTNSRDKDERRKSIENYTKKILSG